MNIINCDACNVLMEPGLTSWHFLCRECGLEKSTLELKINTLNKVCENERSNGLMSLRFKNFKIILEWIKKIKNAEFSNDMPTLLDIGCSYGWFLEASKDTYVGVGVEPDQLVASMAINNKINIIKGYFPESISPKMTFDVIIFNDVIEHIPNISYILQECTFRLNKGGLIIINAPDSCGAIYKIAKMLAFFGIYFPFHRMWQLGLQSPHLYYLNNKALLKILKNNGLEVYKKRSLQALSYDGMLSRVSYASNNSKVANFLIATLFLITLPILRILPSDISVWAIKSSDQN
jgi:2-polyprenyl-3-methyl-5-hydroxy-6-metoxy-1,4-benzoquinol methylase